MLNSSGPPSTAKDTDVLKGSVYLHHTRSEDTIKGQFSVTVEELHNRAQISENKCQSIFHHALMITDSAAGC